MKQENDSAVSTATADLAIPVTPTIPAIAVPLLSLAAFGSGMSLRVTDPLLPLLSSDFGISLGDASLVITACSVAYGLSQMLFGPLGDRHGKYFVVACAAFACAVTATLCAVASDFSSLIVARLLAGVTAAAIIPLSMAWIGDVVPYEQRQPVLARFLIGQILGLSSGVFIGGLAADAHQWRLPFFLVAIIFAIVGSGLLSLNRRLPPHAKKVRKVEGSALRHMLSEFQQIGSLPWARLVLLTVFLEGIFLYGPFAFIATHLHLVHDMTLSAAGAVIMLFGLGGLVFAIASRTLVRRLGETGLSQWGGIILALSLVLVGAAPVWWWAMPGCFMAGLGFYMLHNTLQINATQMAPERRGAAVSAFAACFFLGQSVGVGILGRFVEQIGTMSVMLIGALGVLLISLRFSQRLRQGKPEAKAQPEPR